MKLKCFVLLIFLGACGPSLTVSSPIDESKVKSYSVARLSGKVDMFTIKMKDGHACALKVWDWCQLLSAHYDSSWQNGSSCSCTCAYTPSSFLPSLQTCVNTTSADRFAGECVQTQVFLAL